MKNRSFDFGNANEQQREFVKNRLFTDILPVEETVPEKTNAILDEQSDWINCIRTGSPLRNSGDNAAEAVRIASQVLEQIETHRWDGNRAASGPNHSFEPVAIPIDGYQLPAALQPQEQRRAA